MIILLWLENQTHFVTPGEHNWHSLVITHAVISVLGRCCQHRTSTGPVLATNGMFTGLVITHALPVW